MLFFHSIFTLLMAFGAACFPALCMDRMIHEPWIIRWSHDVLGLMLRSVSPMAEPAGTHKNGAELGNVTLGVQKGGQDPRGGSLQHPSCIFPAAMWEFCPQNLWWILCPGGIVPACRDGMQRAQTST